MDRILRESRNCNHFSKDLAGQLCEGKFPGWVNRLANIGAVLPCASRGACDGDEEEWGNGIVRAPDLSK